MKIKDKLKGKEYLIDIYTTLEKNLQFDREFYAMNNIVTKMYDIDKNMAIDWTIHLLNKYASKGLTDYKNGYDKEANIRDFIETLVIDLCKNLSYKDIIFLIHDNITQYSCRFYLWQFILSSETFNCYFADYMEEKLKNNDYEELTKIIKNVVDYQGYIEEEVFDIVNFISNIIEQFIYEDFIKQKQLDFLYSLIDYVPTESDKSYLKSFFIDYI